MSGRFAQPPRRWTAREVAYLRANAGRVPYHEIAAALGRTTKGVAAYAKAHGLATRAFWTDAEREFVREHFRKLTAREIGRRLGRGTSAVYQCARTIGLSVPQRFRAPDMIDFIRARNAQGWSDSEIAAARGVDRHAIAHVRRELGLPNNAKSDRVRDRVRARTAEQLAEAGVSTLAALRAKVFRERARAAGWPEDLRPRAVQILNLLWDKGPQTRKQIAQGIGMRTDYGGRHEIRKILKSNDPEGSYLAHLMARGLVVDLGRIGRVTGRGRGRSVHVYSLPLTIERKVAS